MQETKNFTPGLKNDEEQQNIERCCLSSILLNSDIPEEIVSDMFLSIRNQTIFNALKELKKVCLPDLNILRKHLQETGELEKAGGIAYIAELTNLLPSSCNINYYADELTEAYYRRSVLNLLESAQNELALGEPLEEITDKLPQRIIEITIKRNQKKAGLKMALVLMILYEKNSHWPSGLSKT